MAHSQPVFPFPFDPGNIGKREHSLNFDSLPLSIKEGQDLAKPEDAWVYPQAVPTHDAVSLKPFHPFAYCGGRQRHAASERLVALPCVLVKRRQQLEILRVHVGSNFTSDINFPKSKVRPNDLLYSAREIRRPWKPKEKDPNGSIPNYSRSKASG